mgnify:CR=1 FL=1
MRMNLHGTNSSLLRAVRALVTGGPGLPQWVAGQPSLVVELFESEPWASLTFRGMRHQIESRIDGPEASVRQARARLVDRLQEPELSVPGHFVADAALSDTGCDVDADGTMSLCLRLQTLTIEE